MPGFHVVVRPSGNRPGTGSTPVSPLSLAPESDALADAEPSADADALASPAEPDPPLALPPVDPALLVAPPSLAPPPPQPPTDMPTSTEIANASDDERRRSTELVMTFPWKHVRRDSESSSVPAAIE